MGLPAVVFEFLFYRDLVIEGRTGSFAQPNAYDEMVGRIGELLADPAKARAMGEAARDLIAQRYDWRRLSRDVIAASTTNIVCPAIFSLNQVATISAAPLVSKLCPTGIIAPSRTITGQSIAE